MMRGWLSRSENLSGESFCCILTLPYTSRIDRAAAAA